MPKLEHATYSSGSSNRPAHGAIGTVRGGSASSSGSIASSRPVRRRPSSSGSSRSSGVRPRRRYPTRAAASSASRSSRVRPQRLRVVVRRTPSRSASSASAGSNTGTTVWPHRSSSEEGWKGPGRGKGKGKEKGKGKGKGKGKEKGKGTGKGMEKGDHSMGGTPYGQGAGKRMGKPDIPLKLAAMDGSRSRASSWETGSGLGSISTNGTRPGTAPPLQVVLAQIDDVGFAPREEAPPFRQDDDPAGRRYGSGRIQTVHELAGRRPGAPGWQR